MTAAVNTAPTAVAMNAFCTDPVGWLSAAPAASLQAAQQFRFDLGLPQLLLLSKSAAVDAGMDASLNFDRFASWTMLFLALYLLFALLWKLVPGSGLQKGSLPFVASSRCIGTVHCVLVVPLGCLALIQQSPDWRLLEYLGPNTALEQRVVELSVGYFVADFVHFILFEPDFLMFFHHVFSILMMSSAGLAGRGSTCAMAALVQGEVTNPFQSAWTIARTGKWTSTLRWLSPLFTLAFVLVRVPLVPLWTLVYINPNLLWGPNASALPGWIVYSWSGMSVLMAAGGWIWSAALLKGLRKFYAQQKKGSQVAPEGKKTKKTQ